MLNINEEDQQDFILHNEIIKQMKDVVGFI